MSSWVEIDDRPEPRHWIERLAGRERATHRRDALDQLLADGALDDEPRTRVAGLAAVVENPPADRRGGRLQVADVGEDKLGTLAAHLEGHALDVRLADRTQERLADGRGPGERNLVDPGVAGQRIADDRPWTWQDVQDAVRQPCFGRQLSQPKRR